MKGDNINDYEQRLLFLNGSISKAISTMKIATLNATIEIGPIEFRMLPCTDFASTVSLTRITCQIQIQLATQKSRSMQTIDSSASVFFVLHGDVSRA